MSSHAHQGRGSSLLSTNLACEQRVFYALPTPSCPTLSCRRWRQRRNSGVERGVEEKDERVSLALRIDYLRAWGAWGGWMGYRREPFWGGWSER